MYKRQVSGCNGPSYAKEQEGESESNRQILDQEQGSQSVSDDREAEEIIKLCRDLYEKAASENKFSDLEVIRSIVSRLGEKGYTAVDGKNQIDMTEAEQAIRFCERAAEKQEAELTIIEVNDSGGFAKYDFLTEDGNVDVVKSCYQYENGEMKKVFKGGYTCLLYTSDAADD